MSTQNVIPPVPVAHPPTGALPVANGLAVPIAATVVPAAQNGSPIPVATAIPVASAPVPAVVAPSAQPVIAVPVAAVPVATASVSPAPIPAPQPVAAAPAAVSAAPASMGPAPSADPAPAAKPQSAPQKSAGTRPRAVITLAPRLGQKKQDWKTLSTVFFISAGLHSLALLACTFIVFSNPQLIEEIFTEVTDNKEINDEPIVEQSMDQPADVKEPPPDDVSSSNVSDMVFEKGPADLNINDLPAAQVKVEGDVPGLADIKFDNAASGRMSTAAKSALVRSMGGNSASEAAVAYGMRWLSKHQMADGGWSFQHDDHPDCKGQCSQPGSLKGGRTGATGLTLLAFLGGGHTHQHGEYQKEVKGGVEFLLKNGQPTPTGFDLCPTVVSNEKMYIQGLCTIALSELAALTKDDRVKKHASAAVNFIVAGQNPKSGGWRYNPYPATDSGDTSVVGWQVMALKSAKNAKIPFPNGTFKGAETYLNAAQAAGGSQYAYDLSGDKRVGTPTMTAAGLLCRMYLGWDRKNKALQEGVKYLAATKPAPNNMYYNYYATQVMHHWGGDEWTAWNGVMRDQLIRSQKTAKDGHMQGSWDLADVHGGVGGRLYMSCLSIMTLEVYYRHLPIYRREGLKVEF